MSDALNGQKGVSEATRRRVLEYAARVGYVPNSAARALSRSRVGVIGVVIRENYSVIRTEPRTTCALKLIQGVVLNTWSESAAVMVCSNVCRGRR